MGTSDHESYCPRCDKTTTWEKTSITKGSLYACAICHIRELALMTDTEFENMERYRASQVA